ncbi:LuxR C-terminal-related transcriptional regulator [Embleya sp. NPDC020630]|uniref:LuxR C-terminal-related transcriptional regulator n=1 Tax=Embleya sp. NPDC020630 TaxID=3363979 RepID=UPI003798C8BB
MTGTDIREAITRAHHEEWARVVAALTRRFGDLDIAEESAAEAFATAVERWPADGVPPNPGAWLTTTATHKAIDRLRRENKRDDKHKEARMLHDNAPPEPLGAIDDDRLRLIFTCCHPAPAMETRVALTLRMVGIAADPALAGVHVVIPTNYGLDEYVLDALRAGAAEFLVKDIVPEDFLHAVRVAARGDALLAPSITRRLIDRYITEPLPGAATGLDEPTNRERESVALVAQGLSNDEIAARMVISPTAAKTHINRAMTKLHARDRAQLVVIAYESGLATPRGTT